MCNWGEKNLKFDSENKCFTLDPGSTLCDQFTCIAKNTCEKILEWYESNLPSF